MNVEEDYDDDKEHARTHPSLLGLKTDAVASDKPMNARESKMPTHNCRIVLEGEKHDSRQSCMVTWQGKTDMVDAGDGKAHMRHLELARARMIRARERSNKVHPRGLEYRVFSLF